MTRVIVDTSHYSCHLIATRLQYVCDFINDHPLCPPATVVQLGIAKNDDVAVFYGDTALAPALHVIPSYQLLHQSHIDTTSLHAVSFMWEDKSIYGLGNGNDSHRSEQNIDIFETIFFIISRYEEWYCAPSDMDEIGNMKAGAQFLVRHMWEQIPIIDHLVVYFFSQLGYQVPIVYTGLRLTHDIDAVWKFPSFYKFLRALGHVMMYQKPKTTRLLHVIRTYFGVIFRAQKDPFDTFEWLLLGSQTVIDKKIYFLSGGSTKHDGFFDIRHSYVKKIITTAIELGYNIGIHPSFDSYNSGAIMMDEKRILSEVVGRDITDSRQHFLRWKFPQTPALINTSGVLTDSSMGFRDRIGFRCGTGFAYRMYDFAHEKAFDFKEIPLIVMDGAAMQQVDWDSDKFVSLINTFIQSNKLHTEITFNFHNSFFGQVTEDAGKIKDFYLTTFR